MSEMNTNMMDVDMASYNYNLPADRIAYSPLQHRHDAKLLVYENGDIKTDIYLNISDHLKADTLLVFNDTRVIAARLPFKKSTGGNIEIFLLEPMGGMDHASALAQKKSSSWNCLVGGIKKWKTNEILQQAQEDESGRSLSAKLLDRTNEYCSIEFTWENDAVSFSEMISQTGMIPLPPYIKRLATAADRQDYQTVYAKAEGSVAAPTAGLHFTKEIFASLENKKIKHEFITLHVGAGTFKPVTAEKISGHDMHEEYFELSASSIKTLGMEDKFIVPVGTTSLRTLESIYWIGVKIILNQIQPNGKIHLGQWEHVELEKQDHITLKDSMTAIRDWMNKGGHEKLYGTTAICITPGYRFKMSKALITNFHQPQSTLLLLIGAIIGADWKKAYDYALNNNFRFLSFGDGSLLFIRQQAD